MLSEQEAERYDRQIRVWGAETQSRIQNSTVLLCGLRGLNTEVVKNVVLAGVNVVVQDSTQFEASDLSYSYLCGNEKEGFAEAATESIQQLNKFAKVGIESRPLSDIPDDFFTQFTAILLSQCSDEQALRINGICRRESPQIVFFWSASFGEEACFISDFGDNFEYKNEATNAKDILSISFPPLRTVLTKKMSETTSRHFPLSTTFLKFRLLQRLNELDAFNPDTIMQLYTDLCTNHGLDSALLSEVQVNSLLRVADTTLVTTASILGSILSQEVIKAISHSGAPGFNVFTFNCETYKATVIPIK